MGLWAFAVVVFVGVLLLLSVGPFAAALAVIIGFGLTYLQDVRTMSRGQSWFIVGTLVFVLFGFPMVVAFSPRAATLCGEQVENFDAASANWAWLPPGVECRIDLDSGATTRFVLPWQEPNLDG